MCSSAFPNAFESKSDEPANIPALPVALNGIIDNASDTDSFRVLVKQGQEWRVRVYSASLGSPIDPRLIIRPIGKDGALGDPEVEKDDAKLDERDMFGTSYRGGGGRREVLDPSGVWRPKKTRSGERRVGKSGELGGRRSRKKKNRPRQASHRDDRPTCHATDRSH